MNRSTGHQQSVPVKFINLFAGLAPITGGVVLRSVGRCFLQLTGDGSFMGENCRIMCDQKDFIAWFPVEAWLSFSATGLEATCNLHDSTGTVVRIAVGVLSVQEL